MKVDINEAKDMVNSLLDNVDENDYETKIKKPMLEDYSEQGEIISINYGKVGIGSSLPKFPTFAKNY